MIECTHCHVFKQASEFYASRTNKRGYQSSCIPCCKQSAKDWSIKNRALINERKNARDKARRRARGLKSHRRTPEEAANLHRLQERDRYQKEGAVIRARVAAWKIKNSHIVSQKNAKRKAMKIGATPIWANKFFLSEAYSLRRLRDKITGIRWHVDHIVPLKHAIVCGLHNEFNVDVIPAKVNCSKQNRYWPGMPNERAKEALA